MSTTAASRLHTTKIHSGHRLSKDIDAFIDDPQYIALMSPRLGGEEVWACEVYDEAAHYLKLIYSEGEIDFIVAGSVTELPVESKTIEVRPGTSHTIKVEHPVEIALKKLNYRGSMLKIRDVLDIVVVDSLFPDLLRDNLHYVAHLKAGISGRLSGILEEFLRQQLDELAIADEWRPLASTCLQRMKEIAQVIPDPK
ncbi:MULTISPECIES: hypothetical protein [unclassified Bradyrhizobium]|uniref:hypothetical protein n=1 Tax=unclassified Bradyrhizobium TaxID=2631580 RepID=UPI00102A1FD8|nr:MULTISPECIES: hypothetical protein [unclassified Bradyrhizobium]